MADIKVPDTFLWITEADVCNLIDLSGSADALEKGLMLEAEGKAVNMTKTQTVWDVGSLNVTGAQFTGDGLVGAKVWSNANLGAAPIIVMHNADDGQIAAIVEAFSLGQMRTASLSSVATKWCALEDADEMAIMGSGHQALPQVAAVAAVRALKRVRVWSRTKKRPRIARSSPPSPAPRSLSCSPMRSRPAPISTPAGRSSRPMRRSTRACSTAATRSSATTSPRCRRALGS
jgi:ornithine cyclodeaminase/alanine dehydrogenase-like protein (mu-crystallin family)